MPLPRPRHFQSTSTRKTRTRTREESQVRRDCVGWRGNEEVRFAMTRKTSFLSVALFVFLPSLQAQQPKTPTLDEILARVESNLNGYDTRVPSLFCDEHVVSSYIEPRRPAQDTVTDSVFRLKRTPHPGHQAVLVESHEIRTVDGKPPKSQQMDGPTLLSGAFEGGLAVVSLNQRACMKYELQRINRKQPNEPYIVRFSTMFTPENSHECLLQEQSKGRVLIDPASMQITHLEINTPRHAIAADDNDPDSSPLVGKRDIAVDYASVLLGGETFWMPSTITMHVTAGSKTFHPITWAFQASYRNYHKLEVTSRILLGSQPE